MTELETLKFKYNMLEHTVLVLQDRLNLKNREIKELKEKLKEVRDENKRLSIH